MDFVVFGGIGAGIALCYMGLKRRGRTNPNFVVGADADSDAPLGTDFIGGQSFALVSTTGSDFLVNVTPSMTGEVLLDNQVVPLPQFVQQRGASFSLGDRGRAKIDCGETSFLVSATPKPRTFPVPFLVWRWSEQAYTVGTAIGLVLFLLMIFSVPPDPKSLSLDLFNADSRFVNFLIKPPEEKEEEIPEWLKKKGPDEQGGKGKRHKGEEGKMGKKTSKNKEGLYGLKGPKDNPDPHLAKKLAEEQAKNAGILGVLKMAEGSHLASIFGRDTAAGNDAENVLGGLIGNQIGEAYGVGGLGLVGTGTGGGGTGEGTIGLGNFGTIGKGGGGGYGLRLRPRRRWPRRPPRTRARRHPRPGQRARLARQGNHPPHHSAPHQRGEVLLRNRVDEEGRSLGSHLGPVHHRRDGNRHRLGLAEFDYGQRPRGELRGAGGSSLGVPQAARWRHRHRVVSVQLHRRWCGQRLALAIRQRKEPRWVAI